MVSAAILVTACASREALPVYSRLTPADINLSGKWSIRPESEQTAGRLRDAEMAAAGGPIDLYGKRRPQSRDKGSLVHVFLETGRNLKITQTNDGLFISFDRSIVEEYRFGEYRTVTVGPVEADRSSGWDEDTYVIETLDMEGTKLVDRYQLEDGGRVLMRQITIYKNQNVDMSIVQLFDKR